MPGAHLELEEAAGEHLVYGEFHHAVLSGAEFLAVEADGADVAVAVGDFRGFYLEGPAVFQVDLHVREVGGSEDVLAAAGADGVEAHGGEDVPGGHLAAVVVAAEAVDVVAVHPVHDLALPVLGLPGAGGPGVEEGYVVAGLVAVDIAAEDALAGDVLGAGEELVGQVHGEQGVEVGLELLCSAHGLYQAGYVMGHVEGVVEGVALDEALAVGAEQVEVSLEGAVLVAGTGVTGFGVEDVAPVAGALQVLLCDVALARIGSGLVDGPVVVGVFEGYRGRTAGGLHGYVAEAHHLAGTLVVGYGGAAHHGFQGPVRIDRDAGGDGIG